MIVAARTGRFGRADDLSRAALRPARAHSLEELVPRLTRVVLPLLTLACSRPAPQDQASVDSTPPSAAPAPPPAAAPWVLAPDHFGPVRIGSSVADLNAVLGDSLKPTYQVNPECDYLFPAAFPKKTAVMIVKDTVVRIDVDSTGI